MDDDFERYTPDTRGLNVADLNRIIDRVTRRGSGYAESVPSFDTPAGTAVVRRPEVFTSLMIQVSAVYTVATYATETLYGYDWYEVVRYSGAFVRPGDGQSGTVYTDNLTPDLAHLNFPAYEIRGSGNAPLNSGAQTRAYLAWISWDERSLEFLGLPPDVVSNVACVNGQIQVTKS